MPWTSAAYQSYGGAGYSSYGGSAGFSGSPALYIVGGLLLCCFITRVFFKTKINFCICSVLGTLSGNKASFALDLTHARKHKKLQASGKTRDIYWARPAAGCGWRR